MAIEKRFIHFKKFSDFNSKKLSANEANTQYTVGISGEIQNGSPDVLYQSYVWIKDTQQQWTHGQIYNGSASLVNETDPIFSASPAANITENQIIKWDDTHEFVQYIDEDISELYKGLSNKQDIISDLETIRSNAAKGGTAVQPEDISYVTIDVDIENADFIEDAIDAEDIGLIRSPIRNSWEELQQAVMNGKSLAIMYLNVPIFFDNVWVEDMVYCRFTHPITKILYNVEITDGEIYFYKSIRITGSEIVSRTLKCVDDDGCLIDVGYILSTKQNVIKDLEAIRDGASKGVTAVQEENLKTINGESIVGSGDIITESDVYVLPFTTYDVLYSMDCAGNSISIEGSISELEDAISQNKIFVIPGEEISVAQSMTKIDGDYPFYRFFCIVSGRMAMVDIDIYAGFLDNISAIDYIPENINNKLTSYAVEKTKINELLVGAVSGLIGDNCGTSYALPDEATGDEDDILLSRNSVKTINGESIVGSGNITIEGGVGTITGVSANGTSVATSGVADIPAASTSKYGVTRLSSATNSTSTTLAATASAVKSAYDLANGRQEKLVSGTNIKTINNTSILGSGNIAIDANIQAVDTQETLDDVNTNTYVKYVAQTLSDHDKEQARKNIGVYNGKEPLHIEGTNITFVKATPMFSWYSYVATNALTSLSIEYFYSNGHKQEEYSISFLTGSSCTVSLPSDTYWANGTVPEIEGNTLYELSVTRTWNGSSVVYKAVLVPFKLV